MVQSTAFGPQGPNYTTVRPPADPAASAGADTFFKNCSAAGAKDGTFATADFFNVTIANIRYLCRTAGVTLADSDDTMIYQAVENLIAAAVGSGGGGGTDTNPSLPKCRLNSLAISSIPYNTFAPHPLTANSNTNLVPVVSSDSFSFTLPVAGTFLFMSRSVIRTVTNNATETGQQVGIMKNGSLVSETDEATYLPSSSDISIDHTLSAIVAVTPTDVLSFASRCGTTFLADYNLGQALAGYFDIIRLGP